MFTDLTGRVKFMETIIPVYLVSYWDKTKEELSSMGVVIYRGISKVSPCSVKTW
jgi:hypothetical protein